jgi:hypothetical protein
MLEEDVIDTEREKEQGDFIRMKPFSKITNTAMSM